jgi:hypothetical protein
VKSMISVLQKIGLQSRPSVDSAWRFNDRRVLRVLLLRKVAGRGLPHKDCVYERKRNGDERKWTKLSLFQARALSTKIGALAANGAHEESVTRVVLCPD